MLHDDLSQLETRLQRLIAAHRQAVLERRHAIQERDRVNALNTELKHRIESIVERIRALEIDETPK
jgi:hypothetical protein